MKTLDRYVTRSFLLSVLMLMLALLLLRVVTDLFVNMDEFTEKDQSFLKDLREIGSYYLYQLPVYFAQLGSVTVVAAAAFTIARMNHSNELTAMMASGVSLRRVMLPIIACSIILSGIIFAVRELVIPSSIISQKLVRDRDDVPGTEKFPILFLTDGQKANWFCGLFIPAEQTMSDPTVIIRDDKHGPLGRISGRWARPGRMDGLKGWFFTDDRPGGAVLSRLAREGRSWTRSPGTEAIWTNISPNDVQRASREADEVADLIVHDEAYGLTIRAKDFRYLPPAGPNQPVGGLLTGVKFIFTAHDGSILGRFSAASARFARDPKTGEGYWRLEDGKLFRASDLTVEDIKLRRSSRWLDYMSMAQLGNLLKLNRVPDRQAAIMTRHVRITEPLNGMVMLLVGVPFILSRQRNVKASAMCCLLVVGAFYGFIYLSRCLGLPPVWAAWLPVLIFGPLAAVMYDAVKT